LVNIVSLVFIFYVGLYFNRAIYYCRRPSERWDPVSSSTSATTLDSSVHWN